MLGRKLVWIKKKSNQFAEQNILKANLFKAVGITHPFEPRAPLAERHGSYPLLEVLKKTHLSHPLTVVANYCGRQSAFIRDVETLP